MKIKLVFLGFITMFMLAIIIALKDFQSSSHQFMASNFLIFFFLSTAFLFLFLFSKNKYYKTMPKKSSLKLEKVKNMKRDDMMENITKETMVQKITFEDVAGLEEVKEELYEIVDFLKSPQKYEQMGAKLPRGVLFYGPPGTGKTLLAKALANEGKASFHFSSGSEFVEKYVGVGAKRVRLMFEKAKNESPSIIFIDEIDAIGAKRTTDSNNEKDQTLNQLLVEMDGFNTNESVIIIGATNRMDLLDEALLRPGRFDRQIYIGNPDVKVREDILKVHFKNKPMDSRIVMKNIAKRTPGMSGAHLANIANEAAILAVRNHKLKITDMEVDMAIEKVLAGPERKNSVITASEKKKIAFHEAGHALVSKYFGKDSIPKISIIPRGKALGYTMHIPESDKYLFTADELKNKIQVLFGGRAAEQLMWNEVSSGAKDDLHKANQLAKEMVCELGMSGMGNIVYDEFMLKNDSTQINMEIKNIIDQSYFQALEILKNNIAALTAIAEHLMENETMLEEELDEVIAGAGLNTLSVTTTV